MPPSCASGWSCATRCQDSPGAKRNREIKAGADTLEELAMLANKDAIATVAVSNLPAATKFYEGTLGLQRAPGTQPEPPVYQAGKFRLLVYQSKYAGTNQATAVTWEVGEDIEQTVQELKTKGVTFEHYDRLPEMTRMGDLHVSGRLKAAWFKDPDGNIHALLGR
jgi:catechol 2,3-dioxygenase-like lactoylglutathione lyase family enzyme